MSVTPFRATRKSFPPPAERPSSSMPLGIEGFVYSDLFAPARLRDLYDVFCTHLKSHAPDVAASYEAYRTCQGAGMTPEQVSTVLLAVAPHVSELVGRLFGVEKELAGLAA